MKSYPRAASVLWAAATVLILSALVCGCGGGGSMGSPTGRLASGDQTGIRSITLNNYNNWGSPTPSDSDYEEKVEMLAQRDRICMTEVYSHNLRLTPDNLRQRNPQAKIYRLYDLVCKNSWDSDWKDPGYLGDLYMCTPITYQHIVSNDWWLRDGNGEIIKENDRTWFLDVGKPGFKEMMLENMLARLEGKGFDGVVLDYHGVGGDFYGKFITGRGLPAPLSYPSQDDWFAEAARPMLDHVIRGLRSRGYEVIVNCAGEYYTSIPWLQWLRSQIDGSIYEVWSIQSNGDWLSSAQVEFRINSFLEDPLEAWTADFGLRGPGCEVEPGPDPEYDRKLQVAVAMYYVSLPQSPALRAKRSYGQYKDMMVHWEPLWDFNIGEPLELPVKLSGEFFWSRRYTSGLVLLNYESDQAITFTLDRAYRTPTGHVLSGEVTLEAHTGLILSVAD